MLDNTIHFWENNIPILAISMHPFMRIDRPPLGSFSDVMSHYLCDRVFHQPANHSHASDDFFEIENIVSKKHRAKRLNSDVCSLILLSGNIRWNSRLAEISMVEKSAPTLAPSDYQWGAAYSWQRCVSIVIHSHTSSLPIILGLSQSKHLYSIFCLPFPSDYPAFQMLSKFSVRVLVSELLLAWERGRVKEGGGGEKQVYH